MRGTLGGPRALLRRLREVMAEPVSAQERLDKIVVLIAANMVAEVCSVYVLRVDGTLELYATEGLNKAAVHQTVLRSDEGLVGLVASEANPINLSDAQNHPAFSYRAETGEEIYHSFLGVPVLRAGNTLGVLVVQNRARRTYTEEEEEALQTTAMVLAEMIASGELSAIAKPGAEPAARRPLHLVGTALNEGVALGHVVLHEPRVVITNFIADDVPKELKRLASAVETMRSDLDVLLERGEVADGGEHRDVLEAYRMFAYDRGWVHRLEEAVASGLTAEAAVERVQSDTRARMLRATDPYLRERLHDLDELANRLMHQLLGKDYAPGRDRLPENAVLVARSMGPAALLEYDRKRLRGLVLEEGGPNSHVAIVARALGIAAVGEIANATGVADPGDAIIVDGSSGDVHLRPSPDMEAAYAERVRLRARRQLQYLALRDKPCITRDGEKIELMINAGLAVDLPHIEETGAVGVGLFRTELQFMVAAAFPRTAEQFSLYRAGLLRSQIRALLRAAGGRDLKIMFPMVATVEEFDEAKSLVDRELTHLRRHSHKLPERVEVGTMLEVPSLLYQLDELFDRVDFLSVGSNDLVQFFYAADRGNSRVADRFDAISAPVLRALKLVADKGRAHAKPVTLCGELASKPIGALALVAIGYRSFSLSPSAVGPVKAMLLDLNAGKAAALMQPLIDSPTGSVPIRERLKAFAAEQGLQI